ncbi:efflux RND transporter periplasmic adaptor subunit [Effusibacillus lacus]|uniref:Uncharacterized protein n=1 Tax=Effusibacillus lacus TaxID=1348429 RepID=A0A292YQ21_9BACL|nr:efflux RND transporter periplasmic adaptor subunit [Effusibacillus lacus]TCS73750.1 RND family efflux transporter MFP subunit [Effusibacillus lacus]GAX92038.1 hypothetical protein EFBL_3729 [Effusibacillus lacus]
MNRKLVVIGMVSALSLSVLAGCSGTNDKEAMATVDPGANAVTVKVEDVKEGEVNEPIRLLAEVSANTSLGILPKVGGTLQEIFVKKGDAVKKGQVLARLDQKDYVLGVKAAEAQLGVARANLQSLNGDETAKRSLEIAQANYDRVKALYNSKAVSQSQLEQAEAQLLQAQSQFALAQANVRQAEVGLEKASSSLDDTNIRATVDGIITAVHFEVGESVSPQSPVFNLINIDPVLVKLNVAETHLSKFKQGMEVEVQTQTGPYKGKVTFISLEADAQSKMYPVEIEIPNGEGKLLPGMKADVFAKDAESKKGLLVSTDAIVEQDGKKFVYVIEGDKAVKREVTVAEGNTTKVIVQQGLNAGDKVVVKGQSNLKDGSTIKVEQ